MSERTPLSELPIGATAQVAAITLEPHEADWLRAVGLFEGIEVRLLRRAPFGGPLHLRTSSGAEFAIDRLLAHAVSVSREPTSFSVASVGPGR